ncbi:Uncharacterized protein FWK35_00003809 [Aphis craccivora]|uniref:Reverse transcriptase domain-containing protein n=1 Tax=Aphis craccivora TaxID=307492 RepID=A0A6G0Z256_APHCR|nr:Uncharacterized protein FWK35_00003809 [Aphis craccivora]
MASCINLKASHITFSNSLRFCSLQHSSYNSNVSQGGILSPILYKMYASDQLTILNTSVADYAYDKVIVFINNDLLTVSTNQQNHLVPMKN